MSHYNWAPYVGFSGRCSGRAMPGTQAFAAYIMDRFDFVRSMGIYNCRGVSNHGDGEAWDGGVPTGPGGSARPELGLQVLELVGPHGKRLGICSWIYARKIYSARSPDGRYYGGVHPHNDHFHEDQTPASALNLTYATMVAVLGPMGSQPVPVPPPPGSGPSKRLWPAGAEKLPGGGYSKANMKGKGKDSNVEWVQRVIDERTNYSGPMKPDGYFGQLTHEAVWGFQGAVGLRSDGVVGPKTWARLNEFAL